MWAQSNSHKTIILYKNTKLRLLKIKQKYTAQNYIMYSSFVVASLSPTILVVQVVQLVRGVRCSTVPMNEMTFDPDIPHGGSS